MANRRIHKKLEARRSAQLALMEGSAQSIYSPRTCVVNVPCPACARGTLIRTYVPAFGSMNGKVHCPGCEYVGTFIDCLAAEMTTDDPLPPVLVEDHAHPRAIVKNEEALAPKDTPITFRVRARATSRRLVRRLVTMYQFARAAYAWMLVKQPERTFAYVDRRALRGEAY